MPRPNNTTPTLAFASCNHTISTFPDRPLPSNNALPRHPEYYRGSSPHSLLITSPSNCLNCTIALTTRNTRDVLIDFASQLRDCEYNYTRQANNAATSSANRAINREMVEYIRRDGQAQMVSISRRRAEAVELLWVPMRRVWDGAGRSSRTGGRGTEREVLNVEFRRGQGGKIERVRLSWRDENGRGSVVGREEIALF